jgi:hypothetical protein
VIATRLKEVPKEYMRDYRTLASRGMRVIAYAMKKVAPEDVQLAAKNPVRCGVNLAWMMILMISIGFVEGG